MSGNQLQGSSKYQASLSAAYEDTLTLNPEISFYISADAAYQSKQYVESMNLGWVPERTIVNASVGFRYRWAEVQLSAKNLLDEREVANALFISSGNSTNYLVYETTPRTYVLSVTARF